MLYISLIEVINTDFEIQDALSLLSFFSVDIFILTTKFAKNVVILRIFDLAKVFARGSL